MEILMIIKLLLKFVFFSSVLKKNCWNENDDDDDEYEWHTGFLYQKRNSSQFSIYMYLFARRFGGSPWYIIDIILLNDYYYYYY